MTASRHVLCLLSVSLIISNVLLSQDSSSPGVINKLGLMLRDLESNFEMSKSIQGYNTLYVHGFLYDENGVKASAAFGDFLSMEAGKWLSQNSKTFHVISRDQIKGIIQSRDWQVEPVSPSTPENIGAIAGAEYVLSGVYLERELKIKLMVYITDVKKRQIMADASVILDKSQIPSDLGIYSDNHDKLPLNDLYETKIVGVDSIGLEVFVNHAADAEYRLGDTLKVFVRADRDCYVRILYRDSRGSDLDLFPASSTDDNFIKAGRVYTFPPDDTYHIVAVEPYGTECLKVFAGTDPRMLRVFKDGTTTQARGMKILRDKQNGAYGEKTMTIRVTPQTSVIIKQGQAK
jgi:hypothetical protein